MYEYGTVIVSGWLLFLAVWLISAIGAKPDVKERGFGSGRFLFWFWRAILAFFVIVLFGHDGRLDGFANLTFFSSGPMLGWLGAIFTLAGIGFAIWARFHLGRNWSSHPAHKKDHELVTSGPYRFVRHPIYTGMILALFGGLLTGDILSVLLFVILLTVFALRIRKEEGIMLGLFPNQYPAYQARTKRLIPFVW